MVCVLEHRFWRAGSIAFDCEEDRLWCDGNPVALTGKPLAVLRAMMKVPRTLVTKEALLEEGWPGVTVSEAVLTTAVKELRQAIGDSARTPAYIATVHGRGYRFLKDVEGIDTLLRPSGEAAEAANDAVETEDVPEATGKPADRWRWAMGAIAAAIALLGAITGIWWIVAVHRPNVASPVDQAQQPYAKSIAVLPLDDFSPGRDQRWFADGLTEEISNSLARIADLRVTSRGAAAQAKARGQDLPTIARSLNVATILEGSVRREKGRVRVTVELVRTADGTRLWSEDIDRPESGVIDIQQGIAFAIASALKTVLDPDHLRAMLDAGTRSVEAYQAYLKGLALDQQQLAEGDDDKARQAAQAYEDARQIDPNFARAHWRAAQSWFGRETRVDSKVHLKPASDDERKRHYLERVDAAILASQNDVDTLQYRAAKALIEIRLVEAERLMQAYLKARPRDLDAWSDFVSISAYVGDLKMTALAAERIQTLSIADGNPQSRAITASVLALQPQLAANRARAQLRLRPDSAVTQYQAHRALLWDGADAEARALLPRIESGKLPRDNRLMAELRQACADRNFAAAAGIYHQFITIPDVGLGSRWLAATSFGDNAAATALLKPYDTERGLPILMQFLIYPMFDPARFPHLADRLRSEGIAPRHLLTEPYACPAKT